ncbi:FtsX-like permease family protein [Stenotrophomonas sp. YAU14A_MKIMI4_1]|uniref:FtsX-like permease family protein n=1 Tax=Stenotrophomonas sp. YAU14A_MKIMI4_1 TaxID=2072408 RepID=UPI000D53FA68|nr:FtsX-like permease family protein [Stenotrophomonas sp. YAU14A_MKIMI4_1]AWH29253.1 ABC transporter permease [Stenotrophomonas sp. YAU14A_MKIMI4_1]
MTDIAPILAALRRHKIIACLVVLEIAFTCAVICNAGFLIVERIERVQRPSGMADDMLVRLQLSAAKRGDQDALAQTRTDLAALRAIPGVQSATVISQIPFGDSSSNSGVNLRQDQETPTLDASVYLAGPDALPTLGLTLVGGRDFTAHDYIDWVPGTNPGELNIPAAIITQAMAERLFPGESAVGRQFYSWGGEPTRVVGVVQRLTRPSETDDPSDMDYSMLFPVAVPYTSGANYLLRVAPGQRETVLEQATAVLRQSGPPRILGVNNGTIEALRDRYYRDDKAMAGLLALICVLLLAITATGIIGLASFWVQQRTRSIGIRRALGATRLQILRYFQTENLLLTLLGSLSGAMLAVALNLLLMQFYEVPRLPLGYLLLGLAVLVPLGQLAILHPALKATRVAPATATRSA